jgi:hypothetical protein
MYCSQCGVRLSVPARFCSSCGAQVVAAEVADPIGIETTSTPLTESEIRRAPTDSRGSKPVECPLCGCWSQAGALSCDCGYDFQLKTRTATPIETAHPSTSGATPCARCKGEHSRSTTVCSCGNSLLTDEQRARLNGPVGWLALYRFGLFFGAPATALSLVLWAFERFHDAAVANWLRIVPILLLVLVPTGYGVYVGGLLSRSNPTGVTHARQHLALVLISSIAMAVLLAWHQGSAEAGQAVGGLVAPPIWLLYFLVLQGSPWVNE